MGRIMTNLALKHLNQQRVSFLLPLSELPEGEEPAEVEEVPEDLLSLDVLLGMIEELPEGYRRIFKLSVLDGLSHSEIAELLHIAPHSSSSQFFRAREYLKRLIVLYRAQILLLFLLLLLPLGYWMWHKPAENILSIPDTPGLSTLPGGDACVSKADGDVPMPVWQPRRGRGSSVAIVVGSVSADTVTASVAETPERPDTVRTASPVRLPKEQMRSEHERVTFRGKRKAGWMLALQYDNRRSVQGVVPGTMPTPPLGVSSILFPPSVGYWDDYYRYLQEHGSDVTSPEIDLLKQIALRNKGRKIEEHNHHELPFTVGLIVQKTLNSRWGFETGLQYTRLKSDFTKGEGALVFEQQELHYLGVPLRATYRIGKLKCLSFYTSAGVMLEIPVSATRETEYIIDGVPAYSKSQQLRLPLQWSVNGALGVQYQLLPSVGIFAEPRLNYYFDDGSGVKTYRKEHPFGITLPVGIRWTY